uniref:Uncharacterized protein n=1 Tax=Arundo donax TaxID=35708 RepID=A0A0A9CDR7_ARUDO
MLIASASYNLGSAPEYRLLLFSSVNISSF